MKDRTKRASGAGAIVLLLLIILANIDVKTGFTEKGIDNMKKEKKAENEYIGKPEINVKDGVMTPDVLLSFGRLSDPQVSPDGKMILYGVSYTSMTENRSCTNLYVCNADGSGRQQLTRSGKSFSNARWSNDGKHIMYLQDGQIWTASIKGKPGSLKLGKAVKMSDIPAGISEFKLSPDQSKVMYVSTVQSAQKKPSDLYPDIDKSSAISADDLMYRHWDHWVQDIPHTFVSRAAFGKAGKGCVTKESSVDILAGEKELYELPTEPFGGIGQLDWSPDGKYIAYSCRKLTGKKYAFSTDTEIYLYEVATGKTSVIDMKGGYDTDPVWSPDGTRLCWVSMERNGYEADRQRLMVADIVMAGGSGATTANGPAASVGDAGIAATNVRELTCGFKYNAAGPVWSPDSRYVYFNSLAEGIQGIFRADVTGASSGDVAGMQSKAGSNPCNDRRPGNAGNTTAGHAIPVIERITGEDLWYDFGSPFHISAATAPAGSSPETVTLLTTWCSMNFPDEIVAITIGKSSALSDSPARTGSAVHAGATGDADAAVRTESSAQSSTGAPAGSRDLNLRGQSPVMYGDAESSTPLKGTCPTISAPVTYRSVTSENKDILTSLDEPLTEARHIRTVDDKDMLTWVIYPPHFDATEKYPSILICLGGPQGTLSQGWSYRWNYRLMASQGYVVVLPNRRGTTAFGQEWTEQISGDYSGLNIRDYLSAARAVKSEPYIGKMAACGASYGGYSVYYLAGVHQNTFDAFIAHAGIFNEEHMYMTTEEMWFANWDNGGLHEYEANPRVGTPDCPVGPKGDGETFGGIRQGGSPWSNAPKAVRHYANSPHKLVTAWDTPILVSHGGMDFRVPVDEGMAAYNAAQLMGVPSRLIIFPDENHWILKPQNALYWHREYFRWLDRWCKE